MTGPSQNLDPRSLYAGVTAGQLADAATAEQAPPGTQQQMWKKPDCGETSYVGSGRLADRVALVTGGDSGIGRAVAIAFAREGADIACCFWKEEEMDDAREVEALVKDAGRRCVLVCADLATEAGVSTAVDATVAALGRTIDIAVLNAGYQHVAAAQSWTDISAADIDRTLATNVKGSLLLAQKVVGHMDAARGPSIIFTSSIQGAEPSPAILDYAASKAALINLSSCLAQDLAKDGVRVNCVCPGPVWTPLVVESFGSTPGKLAAFGKNDAPIGRAAQPAELAPTYVFLADARAASYVSGAVVAVTGGRAL